MRRWLVAAAAAAAVLAGTPAAAEPAPAPTAGLPTPGPVPGLAPYVPASPAFAAAQRAAEALQARVDELRVATEQAVEHYNRVAAALRVAQTRHRNAATALAAARAEQRRLEGVAARRVRSLYIAGPPTLFDITVSGRDAEALLHGYDDARWVFRADQAHLAAAARAAARAAAAERELAAALADQQRLEKDARAAATAVKARLAQQRTLLASASAEVQRLLAEQRAAQQRAAAVLAKLVRDAQARAGARLGVTIGPESTPMSPLVRLVLAAAEAELGKPYQWGATGPAAYDCSGLVQYAFAAAGVRLPRTSREQWYAGTHPAPGDVAPSYLLFWASSPTDPGTIHHVAIYVGNGYMIASPHSGSFVQIRPVYSTGFFGVSRVVIGS